MSETQSRETPTTTDGWIGSVSNAIFGAGSQEQGSATVAGHTSQDGSATVQPPLNTQSSQQTMTTLDSGAGIVTAPSTPLPASSDTFPTPFPSSSGNQSTETVHASQKHTTPNSGQPSDRPHGETPVSGAATPSNLPRRSVTISESRPQADRKGRRQERPVAAQSDEKPTGNIKRSQSLSAVRRSLSGVRQSLSRDRQSDGPVDLLREPRRSIGKRPEEYDLAARDPHTGVSGKHVHRQVAFAAPYARSGVVVSKPARLREWIVPGPLTFGHGQWWYLIAGQSLVAAVISGAINFGVAVATYNHYGSDTPIHFWAWYPVPLAGDMGVTVIIQQIISTLITSALVHHDLTNGPIGPLRRPWPPLLHLPSTPSPTGSWLGVKLPSEVPNEKPLYMGRAEGKGKVKQYFWWFVRSFLTGSERNDLFAKGITWRQRAERVLWTAVQGFILCLLTFPWFWPISVAIVAPIYAGRNLQGTYIPAIIKLLYGAILSLLTNPIMALLAMGAESSVRRAYPELEIWQPFGGEADYQAWLIEQHIPTNDVEIGPRGVARSSTQIRRSGKHGRNPSEMSNRNAHAQGVSTDSSVDLEAQRRVHSSTGLDAENAGETSAAARPIDNNLSAPSPLIGGRPISKSITEEP